MINVVSVCVGTKYNAEHVLILHDMIARNLTGEDQAHWCITDRPEELPEGITAIEPLGGLPGWWQKLALFSPVMPWEDGAEVLYMDLDVCVTGRLEELPHGIIRDWHWPTYNSSVMRWKHGEHRQIWTEFDTALIDKPSTFLAPLLPAGQVNGGDQEWITQASKWQTFPPEWFISYRNAVSWPPDGCKAVIFHGWPKPWDFNEDGWARR